MMPRIVWIPVRPVVLLLRMAATIALMTPTMMLSMMNATTRIQNPALVWVTAADAAAAIGYLRK